DAVSTRLPLLMAFGFPLCTSVSPVVKKFLNHRGHRGTEGKQCRDYFFSAFAISRAAAKPEPPVKPDGRDARPSTIRASRPSWLRAPGNPSSAAATLAQIP